MIFISCSGKPFRLAEEDDIFDINVLKKEISDLKLMLDPME